MNKIKKALFVLVLVSTVGISYALYTLKGLPNTFDWDSEDEQ
jgi:hypothetical protein